MVPAGPERQRSRPAGARSPLAPLLLAAALVLDATASPAGTLAGRVTYSGPAPVRHTITMTADPACDRQHPKGRLDEATLVDASGGLANVIVHVKSGLPKKYVAPPPTGTPRIDQKGCAYLPHVLAVRTGQEIVVGNDDQTFHNVNARTTQNEPFNDGMPGAGQTLRKAFDRPEVAVKLKCDVHPWMSAYIGVFDHPFFAVTAADGSFTIEGLPDGEDYVVEAWHEALGVRSAKAEIDGEDLVKLDFSFTGN
jgi:hypothetical protein